MEKLNKTIIESVKVACECHRITDYDTKLLQLTNTVLPYLAKIGGCPIGSTISMDTTWGDLCSDPRIISAAEGYICGKVQLLFDPPASSAAVTAINEGIKELEWTIQEIVEGRLN